MNFAPGAYQPHTSSGQRLLLHELAHAVQQAEGRVRPPPGGSEHRIVQDRTLEREADGVARAEPASSAPPLARLPSSAPPVIQRKIVNEQYLNETYKESIKEYAYDLNQAVEKARLLILQTPALGSWGKIDGHTKLWVEKITEFKHSRKKPSLLEAAFGYAVESLVTRPLQPKVPAGMTVVEQPTRGTTRPDLVLQVGGEDVAWLDITATNSADHIFKKSGPWQGKSHVEVAYESLGPENYVDMSGRINDNEPKLGLTVAEYEAQLQRRAAELEAKREGWKTALEALLRKLMLSLKPEPAVRDEQRAEITIITMRELFKLELGARAVGSILRAARINPKTYGILSSVSEAEGVQYLLHHDLPDVDRVTKIFDALTERQKVQKRANARNTRHHRTRRGTRYEPY